MREAGEPNDARQNASAASGLRLEPQRRGHAAALFAVLNDPALYVHEGAPPVSEQALVERLAKLESRRSPDGREGWLNWVIQLPDTNVAGYVQATVMPGGTAFVAYLLGKRFWGRGLAAQAVRAMTAELVQHHGVRELRAVLRRANGPSLRLLQRLGFRGASAADPGWTSVDADERLMVREALPDAGPALGTHGGAALVDLATASAAFHEQAAVLLEQDFDGPTGWAERDDARGSVAEVIREGFARALVSGERLLGWIGGLPQYHGRVWELHPLVVRRGQRLRGHGRALVEAFADEATARGALTLMLGTDDNTGMTSLSDADLYANLPQHLDTVRDSGRGHPFGFYRKLGWTVSGVVPDANGLGKPDILMSRRATRRGAGR